MKRAVLAPEFAVPSLEPLPDHQPGRVVRFEEADVFVRETPCSSPAAQPALYVHGLGGSSSNWTDLATLLSNCIAGQAVDLPGFGQSAPPRRYGIGSMADWVIRWVEHEDRGPVHLFGNSMGGAVAVRVAGTRPDLVRSLTLISPAMPFLDPRRSLQGRAVPLVFLPAAARLAAWKMAALGPDELTSMVMKNCFANPEQIPERRVAEAVEEARARSAVPWWAQAYVGGLRALVSSFLRAYLPGKGSMWRTAAQITAPTLVIGGRQDKLVDIRMLPQAARVIPDSRLLMLEGVGHVAQMEVPRLVARAFLGMLEESEQVSMAG